MDFLHCTVSSENSISDFHSVEAAIDFVEHALDKKLAVEGTIRVRTLSGEVKFWYGSLDSMLESLMDL